MAVDSFLPLIIVIVITLINDATMASQQHEQSDGYWGHLPQSLKGIIQPPRTDL